MTVKTEWGGFINECLRLRRVYPVSELRLLGSLIVGFEGRTDGVSVTAPKIILPASSSRICKREKIARVTTIHMRRSLFSIKSWTALKIFLSRSINFISSRWPSGFCIIRGTCLTPYHAESRSSTTAIARLSSPANVHLILNETQGGICLQTLSDDRGLDRLAHGLQIERNELTSTCSCES